MVKKNQKLKVAFLSIGVVALAFVLIFLVGKAFAIFFYQKDGETTNTVTFKGLDIAILNSSSNALNLTGAYPMYDSDGLAGTPLELEITNTTNKAIDYLLKIENDEARQSACTVNGSTCPALSDSYIKYAYKFDNGAYSEPANLGTNNNIVFTNTIASGSTLKVSLLVWIDSTAPNSVQGKYFFGKLILEGTKSNKLSSLIFNDNSNIKTISNPNTELRTVATTSSQSGLYQMTTSNGFGGTGNTTYFFRGAVTNNVVEFAGFTWRIVRINEDGTVRMVLDQGIDNNTRYSFNSSYDDYTYMYYTNSGNYIKKKVDDWYTTNIDKYVSGSSGPKYSDKVVSGSYFCESAKVKYSNDFTSGNAAMTVYSSYTPALDCTQDGNTKGLVNASAGLITYDEVVLAGGYFNLNNQVYYLSKNANNEVSDYQWWTMTPSGYTGTNASDYYVLYTGNTAYGYVNGSCAIRPVINLRSDVTATKASNGHYVID